MTDPQTSTFAPGHALGRYKIVRLLGSGAMGDVYLAEDPQIERPIAIKTVRVADGRAAEVEDRKRRLLREAKAAGRLIHPHVTTLFDAGEAEGVLYLAFEFVDGSDLAQRLDSPPPLALGHVLRIIREAAEALDFAHQHGIVHRDIKPSNILLDRRGGVKVADFGIARVTGQATELTSTGSVVGSPHYLSPEQVRGDELDGRSDVFSLGVVLYEALGHRRPFDGETLTTLVYQILHKDPGPPPKLRAGLSPGVDELLRRMMAKDRDERFRTAGEVADAVRALERELTPDLLAMPAGADEAMDADATLFLTGSGSASPPPLRAPTSTPLPPTFPPAGAPRAPGGSSSGAVAEAPTAVLGSAATRETAPPPPPPPPAAVPAAAKSSVGRWIAIGGALIALLAVGGGLAAWTLWKKFKSGGGAEGTTVEQSVDATSPAASGSGSAGTAETGSSPSPSSPSAHGAGASAAHPSGVTGTTGTSGADSAASASAGRPRPVGSDGSSPASGAGRPPVTSAGGGSTIPEPAAPAAVARPIASPPAVEDEDSPTPADGDSAAVERPATDRQMQTGLSLVFQVKPDDAFLRLRELSERRSTPIGQALDYTGKGREGKSYRLPGPGEYVLSLRKEGLDSYEILISAEEGRGTSTIAVDLAGGAGQQATAAVVAVREGVVLRGEPDSAAVSVDGVARGAARDFAGGIGGRKFLRLEPGLRRLTISAPGRVTQEFEIQVTPSAGRERETVRFDLRRD